jgi:hypothetical protein
MTIRKATTEKNLVRLRLESDVESRTILQGILKELVSVLKGDEEMKR